MNSEELRNFWMISVLAINSFNLLITIVVPLTTWFMVKLRLKKTIKEVNLKKQIEEYDLKIKKLQFKKLQNELEKNKPQQQTVKKTKLKTN